MIILEDRPITLSDLDVSWSELHHIDDSGDDGEFLVALNRFQNRVAALFSHRVADFDRKEGYTADGGYSTTSWLKNKCHLGGRAASNEVRTARRLQELPVARESFERGDISPTHASLVARTVEEVGNQPNPDYSGQPDEGRNVEETLVQSAERFHPGDLWRVCKHMKLVLDPDGALRDWERGERLEYLDASTSLDGMLHLQGLLAPEGAALVSTALNAAMGPRAKDDPRGASERRAEALVDLARRVLNQAELPSHDGERPHLSLLVDYASLRGEPGSAAILDQSGDPVPGKVAERIACDCILTPVVTGQDGDVLRVGRRQRLFSPKQSLAMSLRDRTCAFPGCDRDASWCDNHHLRHWLDGDETTIENGAKLCGFHHPLTHEGGWRLWRDELGEYHADPP